METSATTVKTPPEEPEHINPTRTLPTKPLSFTNGVLKLRQAPPSPTGTYKECLKNHAAAMGGHAVDGCGEYMPSASSLLCAACNCHRNFHRRHSPPPPPLLEYTPHHRHHPPPPPPRSPNSASPPPISSAYAPHMLLALSSGQNPNPSPRKRFRTKFTTNQKEKMFEFAEKLAWKMQRRDEDVINEFCRSIGVEKGVFKVWMHNNKNTLGGKKDPTAETNGNGGGINLDERPTDCHHRNRGLNMTIDEVNAHRLGGSNGSSSSS